MRLPWPWWLIEILISDSTIYTRPVSEVKAHFEAHQWVSRINLQVDEVLMQDMGCKCMRLLKVIGLPFLSWTSKEFPRPTPPRWECTKKSFWRLGGAGRLFTNIHLAPSRLYLVKDSRRRFLPCWSPWTGSVFWLEKGTKLSPAPKIIWTWVAFLRFNVKEETIYVGCVERNSCAQELKK